MSSTVHSTTETQPSAATSEAAPPAEVPSFLHSAGKVTKFVAAAILAIVAIGALGVGITIAPFSAEAGAGALALSTTLFGIAGYLVYSGVSVPTLDSRDLTSH